MEEDINNLKEIVDLCEKEIKNNNYNTTATLDIADLKSLKNILNELDRLQKAKQIIYKNYIPVQKIEKLIKELKQDDINMTRKYKEKKNITGELLGIDKVRVRAYREKTREIKEKLQKILSD